MTVMITKLVDRLSELAPAEREQWLKRFAHELESAQEVYRLSDEERALVKEGIADLDAGRIVSDDDMAAFWQRHRRT